MVDIYITGNHILRQITVKTEFNKILNFSWGQIYCDLLLYCEIFVITSHHSFLNEIEGMHKYVKCTRVVCSITGISNVGIPIRSGASPECFILWNNRWFSARHKNTVYNDCLGISVVTVKKNEILSLLWKVNFEDYAKWRLIYFENRLILACHIDLVDRVLR